MLAAHRLHQGIQGRPLTGTAVLQATLVPAVAVISLSLCAIAFDQALSGAYLILAIIVFSVTFPGRFPKSRAISDIAVDISIYWLLVFSLLFFLGWATNTLEAFDQRVISAWAIATPIPLFFAHVLVPIALPRWMASEGVQRVAVIAGCGQLGEQLAATISASPFLGIRVAGFFEDRNQSRSTKSQTETILGSINELATYVKSHPVDMLYITLPMASQPRILKLLDELRDTTLSIYFAPDIFLSDLIQARLDSVGGIPVVAVCETPFYGINGLLKRASDIILASIILILIAPLMLAIAIAIKFQSPGPVLFKQRRYGLDGREIMVYKFRSMSVAEDGDQIKQATRNDSRVTPFGAFLRRTSLDELPQFINVLEGKMSIVGPRPHAVAHNEQYRKLINGYMIRHKVRPGITGWAQVSGLRGETDTLEKMEKRIEYDLAYLRNWSLLWDFEIILKTLYVVCKKQNAY
jgi:putative colanic acid biosynthesis UDP-glucose lipid carrier transferase